jgi:hypothetical protein
MSENMCKLYLCFHFPVKKVVVLHPVGWKNLSSMTYGMLAGHRTRLYRWDDHGLSSLVMLHRASCRFLCLNRCLPSEKDLEIILLRQQLRVLERKLKTQPRLSRPEKLMLVASPPASKLKQPTGTTD